MKFLFTLLLIATTIYSFDAKDLAKIICSKNNDKGINKLVETFIPFTTSKMTSISENRTEAKRYLKRFCNAVVELDSNFNTLSDEKIDSLSDTKIIEIYDDMMAVILTHHKVTDTLDIINITNALKYGNLEIYNHLISKIQSKDNFIAFLTSSSSNFINNAPSMHKKIELINFLSLCGASYYDELTLKMFYEINNSPISGIVDTFVNNLEKIESKDTKKILKFLKDNKNSIKGESVIQQLSIYMSTVTPMDCNIAGQYSWVLAPSEKVSKGPFKELLKFVGEELLAQNLEEKSLLMGADNKVEMELNNYNDRIIYYLLFCTDDNYKPSLPLEKVYETRPFTITHRVFQKQ